MHELYDAASNEKVVVDDELERLQRDFSTPDLGCVFAFREFHSFDFCIYITVNVLV